MRSRRARKRRINPIALGDQRCTARWLVHLLAVRYAGGFFDLDAAASDISAVAPLYFTAKEDGLKQPWGDLGRVIKCGARSHVPLQRADFFGGRVFFGGRFCDPRLTHAFFNPPWSNLDPWIDKAIQEVQEERCAVAVGVLPSRTGTAWYQRLEREAELIVHFRGRPNFVGPSGTQSKSNIEDVIITVIRPPLVVANYRPKLDRTKRSAA